MTDNKLTNEQIIKVFELCLDEGDCKECLCYGAACITDNDVLACLKRQQAEIKRLEEDKERLYVIGYNLAENEAIKEFAEKLHELLKFYYPEQKFVHTHIDNLVKEMTE